MDSGEDPGCSEGEPLKDEDIGRGNADSVGESDCVGILRHHDVRNKMRF